MASWTFAVLTACYCWLCAQAEEEEVEPPAEEDEAQPIVEEPPPTQKKAAEPERQKSKKELKKKELDDLDAVLKELGVAVTSADGAASGDAAEGGLSKTQLKKLKKQAAAQAPEVVDAAPQEVEAMVEVLLDVDEARRRIAAAKGQSKPKTKLSAAAAAAATALAEAKARAAKGKLDRSRFNQQPCWALLSL